MRKLLLPFCIAAAIYAQPQQSPPAMHLTLAQAEQQAAQSNPQLAGARLQAAAAYQVPAQYRAAYSPNLYGAVTTVGADSGSRLAAGALNNPSVYNRAASGLILNQMITDFGRTGNLVGMARFQAQAQDQVTETTKARILLAASQAYFAVLHAQAVVKVADETVNARQLVVDQVSALVASKLKSDLDLSFAKVNLADSKLLQTQAYSDVKSAFAQLATIMGLPNQTTFTLDEEPMPAEMNDRVDPLIQEAIQNRPELKDLQLQQSAAQRFARAEHDLYFPSVGVIAGAGFAPAADPAITSRYGAIGLNITVPIFNGGLFKARSAEADLKAQAASKDITDEQNRVIRDVRVAYLNATTAYDKLGLTKQLLDQAALALDLAKRRYDIGLGSMVELSQAQLNLTSAQLTDVSAKYDYQSQRVALEYQTGNLH